MGPVQIFATGMHVDSAKVLRDFSIADLQEMASSYDPGRHVAPFLVNHDSSRGNFGTVQAVFLAGERLFAVPANMDPEFADAVNNGRWPRLSIGLYSREDPASPSPGKWAVREVSAVQIPGVKGMVPPRFSEGGDHHQPEYTCVEFSCCPVLHPDTNLFVFEEADVTTEAPDKPDTTPPEGGGNTAPLGAAPTFAEVEALKEQISTKAALTEQLHQQAIARAAALDARESGIKFAEAKARRSTADWQFVQNRAAEGRLAGPEQIEQAFTLLNSANAESICFGEGTPEAKSQHQLFKDFLKGLPVAITYGEFAPGAKSVTPLATNASAREIQAAANKLVSDAKSMGRALTYAEAVQQVCGGQE